MKKLFPIVFLLPFVLSLSSCKDKKETVLDIEDKIEIYYTYKDFVRQLLADNDTISVDLGDTLLAFVETTDADAVAFSGTSNFEIEETGILEYKCVATKAGTGNMAAYSSDLSSGLRMNFFASVPTVSYFFLFVEEPFYTVEVEKESLKNEILAELEDYAPTIYSSYRLTCDAVYGGDLLAVTEEKDTLDGIFTSSDIVEMTDVTMYFDNSTFEFSISEVPEKEGYYKYFIQDLTDVFRQQYPSETINEVSITSLGLMK